MRFTYTLQAILAILATRAGILALQDGRMSMPCYLISRPRCSARGDGSVLRYSKQFLMAGRDGLLHLISCERNEPQLMVRLRMK